MAHIRRKEPRSWFSLFWAHWGWLSLGAAAGCIALTITSAFNYYMGEQFRDNGVRIEAQIVADRISYGDDSDSYFFTFRYQPKSSVYAIEHKVGRSYYRARGIGDRVQIYYLPSRPYMIALSLNTYPSTGILLQVFAAGFGILACVGLWISGSFANRAVKARRYGKTVTALVTRLEDIKDNDGKETNQMRLHWVEPDKRRGKSLKHDKIFARGWKKGDKITVFHGPRDSWWDGDVGPRDARPQTLPGVKAT